VCIKKIKGVGKRGDKLGKKRRGKIITPEKLVSEKKK